MSVNGRRRASSSCDPTGSSMQRMSYGASLRRHVARGGDRPGVIGVEPQRAVADRGAHLAHHLQLLVQADGRELALERRRVVLLDHARAVARDLERRRLARMRRPGMAQREVLGERDLVAHGAAEQDVQGLVLGAPAGVPERHLDRPERALERRHVLPQRVLEGRHAAALALVEVERIEADRAARRGGRRRRCGRRRRTRRCPSRPRRSRPRRSSS